MIGIYLVTGIIIAAILTSIIHNTRVNRKRQWIPYLIKKGRHYSINTNSLFHLPWKFSFAPRALRFSAIFGEGTNAFKPEGDISKLYGMTFGFDPHWRSIRIGWRYEGNDMFQLFIYWYEDGKRKHKPIMKVGMLEQIDFNIFHNNKDKVIVEVKYKKQTSVVDSVPMSKESVWLRFKLYPYFGGNITAPCDMRIFISNQ